MSKVCEFKFKEIEKFEFEKVAKQSEGSVLLSVGNNVILATIAVEFDNPVEEDFVPVTVQYIEKYYSVAKIPGGFVKRESKPSDFETLTSRIIDRSLRPLFPKGYIYPTTITIMVLSADIDSDLQVLSLNAASAALYYSGIVDKVVVATRIAKVNDEIIINPSNQELKQSSLDLFISGTQEELLMIEMRAISSLDNIEIEPEAFTLVHNINEIDEEEMIQLIDIAQKDIKERSLSYIEAFELIKKEKPSFKLEIKNIDNNIVDYIKTNYLDKLNEAIKKLARSERMIELKNIAKFISENSEYEYDDILEAVMVVKREIIRTNILQHNLRADGRGLDDIRDISIELNILPSAHSSCLFTRGQTQALVVATIGSEKDAQMYDLLTEKQPLTENFMVHYNFPSFSVGEAKPIFAPGRRELGHGNLAKRAIEPTIDKEYNSTIRLVSEILESNGSSSMATVCGGSLALKAANIPIKKLTAGIAMGLIVEDNKYAILTDIMGLEDHDGDMDFKVAGTKDGITALQMDIKLGGISLDILKEALYKAKNARLKILDIMEESSKEIKYSDALPFVEKIKIDPSSIMSVIGKAGSVIKEIVEKFEVMVDIDKKSGEVKVSGKKDNVSRACSHIISITDTNFDFTKLYITGEIIKGKVERVTEFGAFVSLEKGGEGLLHISKLAKNRVKNVTDIIDIGDNIEVEALSVKKDRIELALHKVL